MGERNSYNIQFGKDRITWKLKTATEAVLEKAVIVKEISSVKEKPPTLHWDNRKGTPKSRSPSVKGSNLKMQVYLKEEKVRIPKDFSTPVK